MIWIVWSNQKEFGCFEKYEGCENAILSLIENGFEVWGLDMTGFRKEPEISLSTLNLQALEKSAILEALELEKYSQSRAAIHCGVSPRALHSRIHKLKIENARTPGDGRSNWYKKNGVNHA